MIIQGNETIEVLDLRGCGIKDDGLYEIGATFQNSKKEVGLRCLKMENNFFGEKSRKLWREMILEMRKENDGNEEIELEIDFWNLVQEPW